MQRTTIDPAPLRDSRLQIGLCECRELALISDALSVELYQERAYGFGGRGVSCKTTVRADIIKYLRQKIEIVGEKR